MLSHRKVIITGAASGIGKEIVKTSLREGASVIACDINGRLLEELKQGVEGCHNLHTYQVDVSDYDRFF
ncbi:3-oxoacyl-[acyl-carrier protein] reductase [Paenibacillus forsythiae]|uniref:3-oxoacyl-[acyl-carrier protein] reductase n=1 Tax=Paenibacillus forsythiae TaxID=365616 RepID=A0ABU3H9A3_9BACL|nr:3-oxoacyl-[acyl-carrier protein] reductase [Paenibacillus forsythiae]